MEEGLEKLIDTGLERLRDESVRRERLAESLHIESRFAAVILYSMPQVKPDLATRALEIVRSISNTIEQLPEKSSGEDDHPLSRGDLADLEMLAKADIGIALEIVEPTQRPFANKLREQAEMEEEKGAYKAAAELQEQQCWLLRLLDGGDHQTTLEAQLKLAELKLQVKSPDKREEAIPILGEMKGNSAVSLDTELGKRVDEVYERVVSKRDGDYDL
ncbi:hypothetical protein PG989_015557 [Apiospora arundinis]